MRSLLPDAAPSLITETYPIFRVNEAMAKLRTGQPKYRLVLQIK